jgi:hypothetical protein
MSRRCVNCSQPFEYAGNGYCPQCAAANRRAGLYDHINAAGFRDTQSGTSVAFSEFKPLPPGRRAPEEP